MARPTIAELRALVRSLRYAFSIHAAEELADENLTTLDFENVILTGSIVARQRDWATREIKCVACGSTLDGQQAESVVKVSRGGELRVITVYCID